MKNSGLSIIKLNAPYYTEIWLHQKHYYGLIIIHSNWDNFLKENEKYDWVIKYKFKTREDAEKASIILWSIYRKWKNNGI